MTLAERRRAALVATLAAALLASCTGPPATPGSTTSAGHGENVLVREPLPTIPANFKVMAATGDVVWASIDGTSENRLSLDGGTTWTAGVDQREITLPVGYRGRFGYLGGDDGEGTPYEMDPAAPDRAAQLNWDDDGRIVAVGVAGALSRNGLLMTRSAVGRIDFAALPSGAGKAVHSYAFSGDAALVLRISTTAGHDYAALVDTATRKALGTIELPVARQHVVAGSAIHSLVADARGLSVCVQPLPTGASTCQQVAEGDHSNVEPRMYQFGERSLIDDPISAAPLLVENGRVTPVVLPSGTVTWAGEGNGDPTRPLIRTVDGTGSTHHLRVDQAGATTEWSMVPRQAVVPYSLNLTPTTLLIGWPPGARGVEARPLSATGFGQPAWLPGNGVGVAATSGSRWLILADGRYAVYDNGRPIDAFTPQPLSLSGPYVTTGDGTFLISGRRVADGVASFGSLVAERVSPTNGSGPLVLRVRDLAAQQAKATTVRFGDDSYAQQPIRLWGDWVGTTLYSDGDRAELRNLATGQSRTRPGLLVGLSDGYAVLGLPPTDPAEPRVRLVIWNLASDETMALEGATDGSQFSIDGSRIAYISGTDLVVRTIPGVATTQPRLLGAVTQGNATPDQPLILAIDTTKPLRDGTLTISDSTGAVVRTLATPVAVAGSLHDLRWDGRSDTGLQLPAGRYRWALAAAAVDGSGLVVSVTGGGPAEGSITIG